MDMKGIKHVVFLTEGCIRIAVIGADAIVHDETFDAAVEAVVLKDFLKKLRRVRADWVPVVAQSDVLWKTITVPSHDDMEIDQMVRLAMRTAIWDHDEFAFDYRIVGKHEDGHAEVKVGIIHQDEIKEHWDLLKRMGIKFGKWVVSPVADKDLRKSMTAQDMLLHASGEPLEWIPWQIKEQMIERKCRVRWAGFVALAVMMLCLTISLAGLQYFRKTAYLNGLRERARDIRERVQAAEDLSARLKKIRGLSDQRIFFSDVAERLDQLREPSVYLNRLEWTSREGLTLQGAASEEAHINNFQKQLIASRLFDDVVLQYVQRKQQAEDVYFKIRCLWHKKAGL